MEMAICFAWTPAQLALIQKYLDDRMPYRAAAREIQAKHQLKVTHNVIAGLVKRGSLTVHADGRPTAPGSRVTIAEMERRLGVIHDAYHRGNTSGPAIADETGISIHQVWRALRKLGLETNRRPKGPRDGSDKYRVRGKRTKGRKTPRQYINDPVASIGVHFLDKRANHCNYIVAKDPKDGLARYCGGHRVMRGKYFASAYCGEHHIACHKIEYLEAAE